MSSILSLGEAPLNLEQVEQVALHGLKVVLSKEAQARIQKAHDYLYAQIKTKKTFYGVNTGFGQLSHVRIAEDEIQALQYNLLRSHACGMGPALGDAPVRAMLLLRAMSLSHGHSGVSVALVEQILKVLNAGIIPIVPEQGSVGASGDLAPLAHLALVLIGEGQARYKGKLISGAEALAAAGITPITLGPKDGLALINGTQFMTAIGVLGLLHAEKLIELADLAGAMSLEAMRGTLDAFDSRIHLVRPHPGQLACAEHLLALLAPQGEKSEISVSHGDCTRVQDPYSLRCMPQVHGASRDSTAFVRQVLEREINAVTDNPLVFPDGVTVGAKSQVSEVGAILGGGNFHGQIVSIAMDLLAIACAEIASISEQRLGKLVNSAMSDLPAFLTPSGGLNSGFMMVHVTAASLVSENKTLCHPASVDSISTSADKEDHVSMGAWAACKATRVVGNLRKVLSLEFLAAAQGIDLLRPLKSSGPIEHAHQMIRKTIPPHNVDRFFGDDFAEMDRIMGLPEFCKI